MRKKFNFWLQLVTICLCICAIAVGVYSATSAQITASGKIAFSAHNCKVEVTGYIYGHGAKDGVDHADGLPVAKENKEYLTTDNTPITIEGGVSTTTESTIDIGERWFTDMESTDGKPADIVIGINVKNVTIYDITVRVNLDDVTFEQEQVTISCDTESANLKQGDDITFEFTLELNPISAGDTTAIYTPFDLTDLLIPITAVKFVEYDVVVNYSAVSLKDWSGINVLVDGSWLNKSTLINGKQTFKVKSKISFVAEAPVMDCYINVSSSPNIFSVVNFNFNTPSIVSEWDSGIITTTSNVVFTIEVTSTPKT